MRYLLLFIAAIIAFPVYGANESVAAISYNPSRLGAYSHLKIANNAQLSGIDASLADVNIMSKDGVTITSSQDNEESEDPAKIYEVKNIKSMAAYGENCEKHSDFCAAEDGNFKTSVITNNHTIVAGQNESNENYSFSLPGDIAAADGNFPSYPGVNVFVYGGTITGGSSGRVFVKQISADLSKITIHVTDDMYVDSGKTLSVNSQFILGGAEIPDINTVSSWQWVTRTDDTGTQIKILGK